MLATNCKQVFFAKQVFMSKIKKYEKMAKNKNCLLKNEKMCYIIK